jgi:hypothetical protein
MINMGYNIKKMEVKRRFSCGIIDMQVKHCSGKRALDKNNPEKFVEYANFSVSSKEGLGPEFENFIIMVAMNWHIVRDGGVLLCRKDSLERG